MEIVKGGKGFNGVVLWYSVCIHQLPKQTNGALPCNSGKIIKVKQLSHG